jgi:hypothetical protein
MLNGGVESQFQTSATTLPIAAGAQLIFDVSQGGSGVPGASGFQGYIYANCGFPLACGLATITLLNSQDAQVLSFPRSTSTPQIRLCCK